MANTPIRHIRIPDELWNRLALRAADDDRSVSYVLRKAIETYLDETEEGQ